MSKAGERARKEYERRRVRDEAQRRAMRPRLILALLIMCPVTYAAARIMIPSALQSLSPDAPIDAQMVNLVSLAIPALLAVKLVDELFTPRRTTEAFRIGAEGEERIGSILDSLEGYTVHHDLPTRGYGNIDHVVVGPGGIFTVETKNHTGKVRIQSGELRVGGRRVDHLAQARRQAELIRSKVGADVPITPIVCYARAVIDFGWFTSNIREGVRIVGPRGLRTIARAAPVLSPEAISRVNAILSPPAAAVTPPTPEMAPARRKAPLPSCPTCGSEMALRRRRKDGAPFYGCSRYPICRGTSPAT